jgi:hypothetical protein
MAATFKASYTTRRGTIHFLLRPVEPRPVAQSKLELSPLFMKPGGEVRFN